MIKWIRISIVAVFVVVAACFSYIRVTERIAADNQPPVITADTDELAISVTADESALMEGMKAMDNKDGDVTDSMVVVSRSKFIRPGVSNVTYAAFDAHNNVGTYTRRVTYTDYSSPEFSMEVPLVYSINEKNIDYLANIRVDDAIDGNLTSVIRIASGIQTTQEDGSVTMPLTLQVVNSSGDDTEIQLDVVYQDEASYQKDAPALSQYIVYTNVGTAIDAGSYLTGVRNGIKTRSFDATEYNRDDVQIQTDGVDYQTPGVYKIRYTLYSHVPEAVGVYGAPEASPLGTTELYVVVREVS